MDTTPKCKKAMTKDEVLLFLELVENNPIITSKETNSSTNKLKEEAWVKLNNSFNATTGSLPRTTAQLKLKWDNLKKAARKRSQQIRINNLKTGGGKPDFIQPDEVLDRVASLLGSTCSGFMVPFGGDGVGEENFMILGEEVEVEISEIQEDKYMNEAKRKKTDVVSSAEIYPETPKQRHLYGMSIMSKLLKMKGKTKRNEMESHIRNKNISITDYYNTKTMRSELEIQRLAIEIEKIKLEVRLLEIEVAVKEKCLTEGQPKTTNF